MIGLSAFADEISADLNEQIAVIRNENIHFIDLRGVWNTNEVIRRLRDLTNLARNANLILLHENEKEIYGDTIARCIDLLQSINDPHFQAIFDPANFIQCQQTPYPDGYQSLRPWLRYMHVKDALSDGAVVAAGEGKAKWLEILQQLHSNGYDGFFSLEPHLYERQMGSTEYKAEKNQNWC